MELYINENSFEGQFHEMNEFEAALKIFTDLLIEISEVRFINPVFRINEIYFGREIIRGQNFFQSFEHISDRLVKETFRRVIFDTQRFRDWQVTRMHLATDNFFCEQMNSIVTNSSIAEITERNIQSANIHRLLFSFPRSLLNELNRITIFKNDPNRDNALFVSHFDNSEYLNYWLLQYQPPIDWFLRQSHLFAKTKIQVKGAIAYKEIYSGRLWYLDTLHRSHFEVFDHNKRHLGTASLDGNLNENSRDASKDYKL
jgi:hypothetical protein